MTGAWTAAACLLALLTPAVAGADATVFLCEPYGPMGKISPTGHMAVYLDRVCAGSPTTLRRCRPAETGVVISRYGGIEGVDWVAVPLIAWLYAVDRAAEVPAAADRAQVAVLRNAYREAHLRSLAPDAPGGRPPKGNWYQLVGAAYDRRLIAFTLGTTADQDDALIRTLNAQPKRSRFNMLTRNCADFVRDVINLYYPKAITGISVADLGLTTPKFVAKSLVKFGGRRPDLQLQSFAVSRIPGSRSESGSARGVLESLVRKPMYLVPLALVQPWIPAACAAGYLVAGRFDSRQRVEGVYGPDVVEGWATDGAAQDNLAPTIASGVSSSHEASDWQ